MKVNGYTMPNGKALIDELYGCLCSMKVGDEVEVQVEDTIVRFIKMKDTFAYLLVSGDEVKNMGTIKDPCSYIDLLL